MFFPVDDQVRFVPSEVITPLSLLLSPVVRFLWDASFFPSFEDPLSFGVCVSFIPVPETRFILTFRFSFPRHFFFYSLLSRRSAMILRNLIPLMNFIPGYKVAPKFIRGIEAVFPTTEPRSGTFFFAFFIFPSPFFSSFFPPLVLTKQFPFFFFPVLEGRSALEIFSVPFVKFND